MSFTPELLTAAQRAEHLKLSQKTDAGTGAVAVSEPKTMSKKKSQLELARGSLSSSLSTKRNATADIDPKRDADLSFAILPIGAIEPYKHNPRTSSNPRYDEIKASIKADGITNTLTVTRRSTEAKYTTYGGGNTRLQIAKELFDEGDQRFANIQVIVKDWPGDAQVIAAQLSENELRSDITFWEKAQGVNNFKIEFEKESSKPLTASELNRELKTRGLSYGIKTLQNFAFVVEHMAPVGPWLKATEVNETLRPNISLLLDVGEKLGRAKEVSEAIQASLKKLGAELNTLQARNHERDPSEHQEVRIDPKELMDDLHYAAAETLDLSIAQLLSMQKALAANPRLSGQTLRERAVAEPDNTAASNGKKVPDANTAKPTEQAPMPGMLAQVPTAAEPSQSPQAELETVFDDGQALSEGAMVQAVLDAVSDIGRLLAFADVLMAADGFPGGYFVELPVKSLSFFADNDEPFDEPALRYSVWKFLAAMSGQFDRRLTDRIPEKNSLWMEFYKKGKKAFEQKLLESTRTTMSGGEPAITMSELNFVLTQQNIAPFMIAFLKAFNRLRELYPERFYGSTQPLFEKKEG